MPSDDRNRPGYHFEQAVFSSYGINDASIPGFSIERTAGGVGFQVRLRGHIFAQGSCDMAYAPLPFVYDEILLGGRDPGQIGWMGIGSINDWFGFLVVRRGSKWSALLLAERQADMKMFAEHASPFVFDSPEAVVDWIDENKDSFALGAVVDSPSPPYWQQRDWLLEMYAQTPECYVRDDKGNIRPRN